MQYNHIKVITESNLPEPAVVRTSIAGLTRELELLEGKMKTVAVQSKYEYLSILVAKHDMLQTIRTEMNVVLLLTEVAYG